MPAASPNPELQAEQPEAVSQFLRSQQLEPPCAAKTRAGLAMTRLHVGCKNVRTPLSLQRQKMPISSCLVNIFEFHIRVAAAAPWYNSLLLAQLPACPTLAQHMATTKSHVM